MLTQKEVDRLLMSGVEWLQDMLGTPEALQRRWHEARRAFCESTDDEATLQAWLDYQNLSEALCEVMGAGEFKRWRCAQVDQEVSSDG